MSENKDIQEEKVENQEESNEEVQEETQVLTPLEQAEKQAKENLEGWQRAKADYGNLQKEKARRETELSGFVIGKCLEDLLPVYNNFLSAVEFIPEKDQEIDWVKGVVYIKNQLKEYLSSYGAVEMEVLGKAFDPETSEAVSEEESSEHESGIVIKVLSPGYKLNNKVLVFAKVVVAK